MSYCTIDNVNKDPNARLYTLSTGEHVIQGLKKNSKCYLYFDELSLLSNIIKNYNQSERSDLSSIYAENTTNTVFTADDNNGTTYYFAGNPTDNWVSFAGFYWRIVRVNGDGSIRMIYSGEDTGSVTEANRTGETTQIKTGAFNSVENDNAYVGYMYEIGQVHGTKIDSTIKEELDNWYENNIGNNNTYSNKLDGNAGFCGDRELYSGTGLATTNTTYAASNRLNTTRTPTFKCTNSNDLYTETNSNQGNRALTYPIGLITADELWYAGATLESTTNNFYLNTGENYWTMTPQGYRSNINTGVVFILTDIGFLYNPLNLTGSSSGIRPVINLRADVTISSGDGTASNPYVIVA